VTILPSVSRVRQAFNRHALTYDRVFSGSEIRVEVWEIADRVFSEGMHVLDLGCGTGDDAIHFAQRGIKISAIDISPAMIAQLKLKCGGLVQCEEKDMREYSPAGVRFDGVFSNFGALNCVPDLDWMKRLPLSAGAHLVLTTMGPFYPIESAMFLLQGRPRLAFRRFGNPAEAVVEGVRFNVYFHTLRSIRRQLGPEFALKDVRGIRSLMPLPAVLRPLDRWLSSFQLMAPWSDHFVSVWQYRAT
jgi:ubiquinone/menaquinone biosynthesis C-methylase UbiE